MPDPIVFHALGDTARRDMLQWIANRESPPSLSDVARAFAMSRQGATKHLRILREAGLVLEKRQGRKRVCAIDPTPLNQVAAWIESVRDRKHEPAPGPPAEPEPPVESRSLVDDYFPL